MTQLRVNVAWKPREGPVQPLFTTALISDRTFEPASSWFLRYSLIDTRVGDATLAKTPTNCETHKIVNY